MKAVDMLVLSSFIAGCIELLYLFLFPRKIPFIIFWTFPFAFAIMLLYLVWLFYIHLPNMNGGS